MSAGLAKGDVVRRQGRTHANFYETTDVVADPVMLATYGTVLDRSDESKVAPLAKGREVRGIVVRWGRGRDAPSRERRGSCGCAPGGCGAASGAGPTCRPHHATGGPRRPTTARLRGAAPRAHAAGRRSRTGPGRAGTGSRPTARASRSGRASGDAGGSAWDLAPLRRQIGSERIRRRVSLRDVEREFVE